MLIKYWKTLVFSAIVFSVSTSVKSEMTGNEIMRQSLYPKAIYLVSAVDEAGDVLTEVLLDSCRSGTIAVNRKSPIHAAIENSEEYVIIQPSKEMKDMVMRLIEGEPNNNFMKYLDPETIKTPLLKGGRIYRECRVTQKKDVGDSTVFLGKIVSSRVDDTKNNRLFLFLDDNKPKVKAVPANGARDLPERVVLITSQANNKAPNVMTVGSIMYCSVDPLMIAIWIGKTRHSYGLIKESGEFGYVIPGEDMKHEVLYSGTRSGRDVDKFKELSLDVSTAEYIKAPLLDKAVANMECRIKMEMEASATHTLFIGEVKAVHGPDETKQMLFYLGGPWHKLSSYGILTNAVAK